MDAASEITPDQFDDWNEYAAAKEREVASLRAELQRLLDGPHLRNAPATCARIERLLGKEAAWATSNRSA